MVMQFEYLPLSVTRPAESLEMKLCNFFSIQVKTRVEYTKKGKKAIDRTMPESALSLPLLSVRNIQVTNFFSSDGIESACLFI